MLRGVQSDDRRLVARCLQGDTDALRSLVEHYQGAVFGMCFRITRHRQDAEDITQEVMLRAIRSLRSWDRRRPLRPWILAIAANRCRTYLSRLPRRPVPAEKLSECTDERRTGPDGELAAELELALAHLRPEYRLVVVMYHEQQMEYAEISQAIARPIGTVKTWLHLARAEMAQYLARRPAMRGLVPEDRL